MKFVQFSALRRSGHHAIINWYLKQLDCNYLFLNDVNGSLFRKSCPDFLLSDFLAKRSVRDHVLNSKPKVAEMRDHDLPPELIVYNIEDMPQGSPYPDSIDIYHEPYLKVMVLRDPFNNMVSRMKRKTWRILPNEKPETQAIELWKDHARFFISEPATAICVNYNSWFLYHHYRKALAKKLSVKFSDQGLQEVCVWGFGSSFDKLDKDGEAQHMKVLHRYEEFLNSPDFLALFDQETKKLARTIFHMGLEKTL